MSIVRHHARRHRAGAANHNSRWTVLARLMVGRRVQFVAWRCNRCRVWVPPRRFCLMTGTCRRCVRQLSSGAGWAL
jgi:uncharacterized OB-fold protein